MGSNTEKLAGLLYMLIWIAIAFFGFMFILMLLAAIFGG
jgi:hypothetical protein